MFKIWFWHVNPLIWGLAASGPENQIGREILRRMVAPRTCQTVAGPSFVARMGRMGNRRWTKKSKHLTTGGSRHPQDPPGPRACRPEPGPSLLSRLPGGVPPRRIRMCPNAYAFQDILIPSCQSIARSLYLSLYFSIDRSIARSIYGRRGGDGSGG